MSDAPKFTPVDSSAIAAVHHDPKTKVLQIKFRDGAHWDYHNVPDKKFQALLAAESAGRYFGQQINGAHRQVKHK